ncbi:HD domain-containing protein [uncultured Shewanella sp.]|uniref:HD domain-containing protein n=1 Tax=uncultured Shewanella sp. TaxID=173975 RepID=UPI00262757B0|nr:HD domain-containing protein [uncultured Shewanella sp.]
MSHSLRILTSIPELEALFEPWKDIIGEDYHGYRNHVYRMVQFCFGLKDLRGEFLSDDDRQKIMIAGVFHDIGIWVQGTLDYISPSVQPAMTYLANNGLSHWQEEVRLMIENHHKLIKYKGEYQDTVELFRQGDVVDFTLGLVKFDLTKENIQQMKTMLPNNGFHKGLLKKGQKWFLCHPLNPVPMMKW